MQPSFLSIVILLLNAYRTGLKVLKLAKGLTTRPKVSQSNLSESCLVAWLTEIPRQGQEEGFGLAEAR